MNESNSGEYAYPSIGSSAKLDDKVVTGEKYWLETEMPATVTESV
jgi:hypothetical protein